ncbi:SpoIIE family protein phosphatase [Candidatus Poribacteria bacterium]|nr:SpoIIE family protein phosphatase [Candidatus Poribacteria bacterium]
MKIRYKISVLVICFAVAIIILLNLSYIRIISWATDEFVKRVLSHQVTNILIDFPSEDEIDWDEIQRQLDQALSQSDDLLYATVYTDEEIKTISMNISQMESITGHQLGSPQEIMRELNEGSLSIENAREVEILAQSESAEMRVVIGYILPVPGWVNMAIVLIAVALILIFSLIAVVGSFVMANSITKPIRKLAAAMQNVSKGDLDIAVRIRSQDEVGQLAKVFNQMIYQLKEKNDELEQLNQTLEERVQSGIEEIQRREEAEKQRLVKEIQRAREVQMGLFPKSPPNIPGLDIWGICRPASETGGDFFDYLSLSDSKLCLVLGDVSGKGMKGAMNAVMAYGMLHTQTRLRSSAPEIIHDLNESLSARLEESTFTALSLGIVDSDILQIQLCNAGNPYPVMLRNGKAELLKLSGMPLGIIPDIDYDEAQIRLQSGDVIFFYSDGISEATNENEDMYGMESLKNLVQSFKQDMTAQEMVERVLQDIKEFVADNDQSDDITLIALKVNRRI